MAEPPGPLPLAGAVGALPTGMDDVTAYPVLLEELARRGWTKEELAKVAGENVLRVMAAAEKIAAQIQQEEEPAEAWFDGPAEGGHSS